LTAEHQLLASRFKTLELQSDFNNGCVAVREIVVTHEEILYEDINEIDKHMPPSALKSVLVQYHLFAQIPLDVKTKFKAEFLERFFEARFLKYRNSPSFTKEKANEEYLLMRLMKEFGDKKVHDKRTAFCFELDSIINHPDFFSILPNKVTVKHVLIKVKETAYNSPKLGRSGLLARSNSIQRASWR